MVINPIVFYVISTILLIYFLNKFFKAFMLELSEWLLKKAKKEGTIYSKTKDYTIYEMKRWGLVFRIREFNEK